MTKDDYGMYKLHGIFVRHFMAMKLKQQPLLVKKSQKDVSIVLRNNQPAYLCRHRGYSLFFLNVHCQPILVVIINF
jgi:hypothetical protein